MTLHLAVDIGGTRMRVGLVDEGGQVVQRAACATASAVDGAAALAGLAAQLDTPGDAPAVVGLPGRIDYQAGVLEMAPNLPPAWVPGFREDRLTALLGRTVHLANDADLAAVGETWFGAGRGHADVLYVTISTGIGAGIVVGGTLVRGTLSGGEIGHTVVDLPAARRGDPATVELLGSGTALNRIARRAGFTEQGKDFIELVRSGHAAASELFDGAIFAAAIGITNLCWLVVPQVVVIGGGMGRNIDLVEPIVRRALEDHGPAGARQTLVTVAALGDDAALAGAAAWWTAVGRE